MNQTSLILRSPEVCRRTGKSRAQIWRDVRNGNFPAPIQLGPNAIGWHAEEVDEWLKTRPRVAYSRSNSTSAGPRKNGGA